MAVFRRKVKGKTLRKYYMKFMVDGRQVYKSCKTTDPNAARKRERELRRILEDESWFKTLQQEALRGIAARTPGAEPPKNCVPMIEPVIEPAPAAATTFREFVELPDPKATPPTRGGQFWRDWATNGIRKPNTLQFYRNRLNALLDVEILANAPLNQVGGKLLVKLDGILRGKYKPATVNACINVLSKVMTKAYEFELIPSAPKMPKRDKPSQSRWHVLSVAEEQLYMQNVDRDQKDYFLLLIDTAIEPGPSAVLDWSDVYLDAIGEFTHGYVHGRCQKRDTRERDLPLTPRLQAALRARWFEQGRPRDGFVFPACQSPTKDHRIFQNKHQALFGKRSRSRLRMPKFRLYDLRHTCLTRLAESGADVLVIQKFGGWQSLEMANVYIHASNRGKAKASSQLVDYIAEEQAKLAARKEEPCLS